MNQIREFQVQTAMKALDSFLKQDPHEPHRATTIRSTASDQSPVQTHSGLVDKFSVRINQNPLVLASFRGSPHVIRSRCFLGISQLLFGSTKAEFLHFSQTDVESTIIGDYDITRRAFQSLLPAHESALANDDDGVVPTWYPEARVILDVVLAEGVGMCCNACQQQQQPT
jgi:hypothetical protein